MNATIRFREGQHYQLTGKEPRVLLHFPRSNRPRQVSLWQWVRIRDPRIFAPDQVAVNLRGPVVWVDLLDGSKTVATGYAPLSLFEGPRARFKLDGKEKNV